MPFDLDERFMAAAENALDISLPESYRQAMLRCNGGRVAIGDEDWEFYSVADHSDKKRVARTCNGVLPETAAARSWRGFPTGAVVIGHNGEGDLLVFLKQTGKRLRPEVFIWRHTTRDVERVADDFSSLC